MAIYHCSSKPVSRSGGRSAVAAIAYRTASLLTNERDGLTHDFTAKQGVDHCEIILPDDIEADWALDRARLWNAAEAAEHRRDARVAREFEIALPHELERRDQLDLARAFAQDLADRYGAAVDFAIHVPLAKSDRRNVHAHVMMTTRDVTPDGFGEKTMIERENKWLLDHNLPTSHMQMRDIRKAFADLTNRHLMLAGLDLRVDHRSHLERGLSLQPTEHMGVHASQMERRGLNVSRSRIEEKAAQKNADLIARKPDEVLRLLTDEKSVFDRHDVARTLHRYINDNDSFQRALAAVMASPQLVELLPEQDEKLARYSTREMIAIEQALAISALNMADSNTHGVRQDRVDQALDRQDGLLGGSGLSDEQRLAVHHITSGGQIAAVIGFAGAGKSTMLSAARDAWEAEGYRVHGAALAGKAADGLTQSSGIAARTLASWEYGWQRDKGLLQRGDIFVIDEAGMVGSKQLARFVREVEARGAKLVLVGDHEQLQAIGAGSPFRAIAERIATVELTDIRRQSEAWQREASVAFATHKTADGLRSYASRNAIRFAPDRKQAIADLVRDYRFDLNQNPDASRIALAHRRIDVRAINDAIRAALQADGVLAKSDPQNAAQKDCEIIYQTIQGSRSFARGDRIVLLQNNRDLGVKNGMLGTVEAVEPNALHLRLDGYSSGNENSRHLTLPVKDYQAFDHGYATTIHKAQGATVERAFVMASSSMDRHLTYVAMTRHRKDVTLYAGRDDLKDMRDMTASLGRSGAKETTLDYEQEFPERRGLLTKLDRTNDIALAPEADTAHDSVRLTGQPVLKQDRPFDRRQVYEEPVNDLAGPAVTPEMIEARRQPFVAEAGQQAEAPAPLIRAITQYDRTIEDIARQKALPHLERDLETMRSVAANVFRDPFSVTATLKGLIIDGKTDTLGLVKSVQQQPEQFGELVGKTGLFGDSSQRKQARSLAHGLSSHVGHAAQTWERQLNATRQSETWQRQKRDIVEVPGLSPKSEVILKTFDRLDHDQRQSFLEKMANTPDGRQALHEAEQITRALEQRFGTSDRLKLDKMDLRVGAEHISQVDHIRQVARLVEKANTAELTRKRVLGQKLGKTLGLGL